MGVSDNQISEINQIQERLTIIGYSSIDNSSIQNYLQQSLGIEVDNQKSPRLVH